VDSNLVSERISDVITSSGFSYSEISKMTGIPKSALQRYATGATEKIPPDRIRIIALKLRVSIGYLLGFTDDKNMERTIYMDHFSKTANLKEVVKRLDEDDIQKVTEYAEFILSQKAKRKDD
jgi:transcriptional regulator with XRE-family HTH domain